jgi:hypothetical protein
MMHRAASLIACVAVFALSNAAAAAPQAVGAADRNADIVAVRQYRLTMDKVEKLVTASQALNKMIAADPAIKTRLDSDSDESGTIDQKVKVMEVDFPQAAAVVHASGLTTRDYIMVGLAFMNDVMIVSMKKGGLIKDYPANSITPENAAFVEQNFDKLKQLSEKLAPPNNGQQ